MGQAPIRTAGHVLRHAIGVLLLSWVRALRAGFIAGLSGVLIVEIGAMVMTRHFPPDGNAQLVAALLGFALAFGTAATVVVDEILEGIRDLVDMLGGEAEAGARVAASLGEREVGESSASVLRLVGLGGLLGRQPAPGTRSPGDSAAPVLASPLAASPAMAAATPERTVRTDETLAELAAEPSTPAQPRPEAIPVRADHLPRLAWADEMPVVLPLSAVRDPVTPPGDTDDLEPAEGDLGVWHTDQEALSSAEELPAAEAAPADGPGDEPGEAPSVESASPFASAPSWGLAEPSQWHASDSPPPPDFAWHDPTVATEPLEDEENYIQPIDVFGAPPPLAPAPVAETPPEPLAEVEPSQPSDAPTVGPQSSVWDHISQVLAGRPVVPPTEEPVATDDGDGGSDSDAPQAAQ